MPAKVTPVGASQYLLCGALQFLSAFGYSYLIALVFIQGYEWISAGSGFVDIYCRAILAGGAGFLGMCHPADPGEVDAHRALEAPADPRLEPQVLPFLARQNPGAIEPASSGSPVRRYSFSTCGRWVRRSAETC